MYAHIKFLSIVLDKFGNGQSKQQYTRTQKNTNQDVPVKTSSLYRGIRVTNCNTISTLRPLHAPAISDLGKAPAGNMGYLSMGIEIK